MYWVRCLRSTYTGCQASEGERTGDKLGIGMVFVTRAIPIRKCQIFFASQKGERNQFMFENDILSAVFGTSGTENIK